MKFNLKNNTYVQRKKKLREKMNQSFHNLKYEQNNNFKPSKYVNKKKRIPSNNREIKN